MIIPNTQILTDEQKLALATKEQDGTLIASGGEKDLTCLVESNGKENLAVKTVNVESDISAESKTSTEVLTEDGLAIATLGLDGDTLSKDSKTDVTCLVDDKLALKTFPINGTVINSKGTTCLVEADGKKQLALKVFNYGGGDWQNKPESWPDIRENAQDGHIYLLADNRYNLGFKVTCTGGYSVDIDGTHYQDYASDAQFSMNKANWPNTGYAIDYPSGATKAHIIDIYPQSTNDITLFQCRRVASSGREQQGVLWANFCTTEPISLDVAFASYNSYYNPVMLAITAKNNTLKINKLVRLGQGADLMQYGANVEYLCTFDLTNSSTTADSSFNILTTANLEQIKLKNGTITGSFANFATNATKLKKINLSNFTISPTACGNAFRENQSLEQLPNIDYSNVTSMSNFLTNAKSLKETVLDVSSAKSLKRIGCYGDNSHFMSGFKGLRVSSQAPFNDATAPQINVSYTGMERQALVTLFNDLPTVTNGQKIDITGCTGINNLTPEDVAIAENKGWTITGKPVFSNYYAYKDGQGNLIYSKNSTASIDYTLENLTNTNCTDLGDGVYQGGANKYFVTNSTPAIGSANSWEFKTKVKYVPGGGNPCIFGCSANDCQTPIFGHIIDNQIYALLSSNGSSWDLYATLIKDIDTEETLTLSAYTTYYFKFGFTGTEYYLWYSTVGFDDTGKTLTFLRTSTKVYCAEPLMLLNNHFDLSAFYWGGTIDLTQTNLVVNGVETSFCEVTKSTLYNSSLQPMPVQPDYILGKGIEVTDMQNGALILPTQQPVSSMELCVHYKTNNSFPNLQLTGGADETTHSGIYFQNYDSYLNTWISSNGSSYDIASNANIASGFVNDTEYWLKATWDGTKYEFYTSTDGTNFVKSYQVINSTSPIFWNNSNLYLGNNSAKSFTQVYAKYFLDGTYLKVDGVTVFDGSLGTGYTTDGCTVSGFIKGDIKFNNTVYGRSPADDRQAV